MFQPTVLIISSCIVLFIDFEHRDTGFILWAILSVGGIISMKLYDIIKIIKKKSDERP